MNWKTLLTAAAVAGSLGLLSSGGAAQAPAGPNREFVQNELLVQFRGGTTSEHQANARARVGGTRVDLVLASRVIALAAEVDDCRYHELRGQGFVDSGRPQSIGHPGRGGGCDGVVRTAAQQSAADRSAGWGLSPMRDATRTVVS